MGQRLYFDVLPAMLEETKGSAAQSLCVFYTSEAASLVALSILILPDPKAASLFMGCAKGGRIGTSRFVFFPTDTRSLASLSYQFSSHPLACI